MFIGFSHWIDKIYIIGPLFLFMLHYLVATCYGDTFKIMNNCLQTFILTLFEIVNIPLLKVFFLKDQISSRIFSGTILGCIYSFILCLSP